MHTTHQVTTKHIDLTGHAVLPLHMSHFQSHTKRRFSDVRLGPLVNKLITVFAMAVLCGCGPPDTSRSEMNPRKQRIYAYASSLVAVAMDSSVMGIGGPSHPGLLKDPYPTRFEMESAIGKADFSQMESVGELHPLNAEGSMLTLYWWEKDYTWKIPGLKKDGFREIIIARFDKNGRLRMLEVLNPVGYELIGRHSSECHWIG